MNTTKMKIDSKAIMIIYSDHAWGNRKQANKDKINANADKSLLSISKRLLDSSEYREITSYQLRVKSWLINHSVPSFFTKGSYLISSSSCEAIEDFLISSRELLGEKVERFLTAYEERIEEIEARLGDQFDRRDYPSVNYLRRSFSMDWKWVAFDVPDTLPKTIFDAEKAKAEKIWADSAEQISQCLRESFVQLINNVNRNLQPDENGRAKGWKNASFDNVKEFLATFNNRNIVNDTELAKLVEKARKTLSSVEDPQELKKDEEMRTIIKNQFSEISKTLGGMIQTKVNRKFDFEE
jgi:hypothetical protein